LLKKLLEKKEKSAKRAVEHEQISDSFESTWPPYHRLGKRIMGKKSGS